MSANYKVLPLFFRELMLGDEYLISNIAGAYAFLRDRKTLEALVDNDVDKLTRTKLDELVAKNFISPSDELDTRSQILASHLATKTSRAITAPSLFIIIPTLRCDHDCGYCQVSRAPIDKHEYDLDENHIERILSVISSIAGPTIKIEFQGGEPLLSFSFVQKFYCRAQEILSGIDVSYVICTATGPLDNDIIQWAKDKAVYFSVSLDGPEHVHVMNRPSRYFNTYRVTIDSFRRITQGISFDRVSCLTTISRYSLAFPQEIVRSYYEIGLSSIFLRPLSPYGFASKTQDRIGYSVNEFMSFYKECLREIIKINAQTIFIEETALIHLKKIFQPQHVNYVDLQSPAGYLFGALIFNYDGHVFGSDEARMLWQSTKNESLIMGHLSDSELPIQNHVATRTILKTSFIFDTPGCDECVYQPFCGADPLHHLATQGEAVGDKSFSFFCQMQIALYDHLFFLWKNDENAKKVFESWLAR